MTMQVNSPEGQRRVNMVFILLPQALVLRGTAYDPLQLHCGTPFIDYTSLNWVPLNIVMAPFGLLGQLDFF